LTIKSSNINRGWTWVSSVELQSSSKWYWRPHA